MKKTTYSTVDEYINSFPLEVQQRLKQLRATIRENAPGAAETIAYQMPAYKFKSKPLVYFGAYQSHIGFYATPIGHSEFADELSQYKQGKGSVQFPMDKPMPLDLIARMVRFRMSNVSSTGKKM
jgi:uncharacterized protein YdhG (YjbR/CyaY superfamily)